MKQILPNRLGEYHISNQGCKFKIIKYNSYHDCDILFDNGHIVRNITFRTIITGAIKNPYHPSVYGVGYMGIGEHGAAKNKKSTPYYKLWCGMLERGYDEKYNIKNPTYKDVIVCEGWKCFQNFANWSEENYVEGFHLDKDILVKGNKIYSPETCCFVPQEINMLFTSSKSTRGNYPIGVRKKDSKFQARINMYGEPINLGYFDTIEEAFQAYKVAKELYVKEMADKWRGQITKQCYQALYDYQVEITD